MILTDDQVCQMATEVVSQIEHSPISHKRKCQIAREFAIEQFNIYPRQSAILLSVKIANHRWDNIKNFTHCLIDDQL